MTTELRKGNWVSSPNNHFSRGVIWELLYCNKSLQVPINCICCVCVCACVVISLHACVYETLVFYVCVRFPSVGVCTELVCCRSQQTVSPHKQRHSRASQQHYRFLSVFMCLQSTRQHNMRKLKWSCLIATVGRFWGVVWWKKRQAQL